MQRQRVLSAVLGAMAMALALNVVSLWGVSFGLGCADCMAYGGVPVLFVGYGGFFSHWEFSVSALAADAVFALVVAATCGAVAMWLPRLARHQ